MRSGNILLGAAIMLAIGAAFYGGYYWSVHGSSAGKKYESMAAVTSGLSLASRWKTFVSAFYDDSGEFPSSNEEARIPPAASITDRYVARVEVGPQGAITITYRGLSAIEGKTLVMKPTAAEEHGPITSWSCKGGTVAPDDRPDLCR